MPSDMSDYYGEGVSDSTTAPIFGVGVCTATLRPPLPSKINGPASFLGVIGPSTPDKTSGLGCPGLGVRRSALSSSLRRFDDDLFDLAISIGALNPACWLLGSLSLPRSLISRLSMSSSGE